MSAVFAHIEALSLQFRRQVLFRDLSWQICRGEQWLITGASGTGKTSLAKAIAGLLSFSGQISLHYDPQSPYVPKAVYVAQWFPFRDKQGTNNFYYQQRYNSSDAGNSHTLAEELLDHCRKINAADARATELLETFGLTHRAGAPLIQLSSGEHKKLQLCRAFLSAPQLLILDNPYTGLDKATRENLNKLLNLHCSRGMQLIMISNDGHEPSCINRFATLADGKLLTHPQKPVLAEQEEQEITLPEFLLEPFAADYPDEVILLDQVNIRYGDKQVLKAVSWTVSKGEKWLLQGHNGSGKSTLLSLLTGDHPQAYANNLYLFGKKRGTGESIWEIKSRTGFISPELQWYFEPSSTVFQAVASGFFDTSGLFRSLSAAQQEKVNTLLQFFGLETAQDHLLSLMPLGKQRLALLARAIIKNPPLLILDEPCQGLDQQQTLLFNRLVDALCTGERTLIYVGHLEYRLPECITGQLTLRNGVAESTPVKLEKQL